jgi:hypothetical protein
MNCERICAGFILAASRNTLLTCPIKIHHGTELVSRHGVFLRTLKSWRRKAQRRQKQYDNKQPNNLRSPMLPASLKRYAYLSIAAALSTILLKGVAWWMTGSVGLLSDALESSSIWVVR